MNTSTPSISPPVHTVWRDIAMVAAITAACVALAAHFELNETVFHLTRQWEFVQVDELPLGLLVFALCLVWLAWRRYREARAEVLARQTAEARLAGALADNRRLAQGQLRVQEDERKNLARELHDELGQYLNAIKLDAVSIYDPASTDLPFIRKAAFGIIQTTDHVHGVVSDMIRRLRPVGLDELGLAAALEHCIDHWRGRRPQTQFTLTVRGSLDGLEEPVNLTIYRIMQEGLTNAYKHADARHVDVMLERNGQLLDLTVTDDGRGMQQAISHAGYGLNGMRERAEAIGGRFTLESSPGQGVSLKVNLPTRAPQQ